MSNQILYNKQLLYNKEALYVGKVKNDSLKINFNENNKIIYGLSFLKNDTIYLNNTKKTIFYFMKTNNKS
tara:strand:- start:627 stop:836 length:210 start_codon:yes stop_codon:yes gene_type:complete